jgi:hypothetical protein
MTTQPIPCVQETLSVGPALCVQRCKDCGCISLHFGPATVRMDEASLREVLPLLGLAVGKLEAEEQLKKALPSPRGTVARA